VLPDHEITLRTLLAELNFLDRGGYRSSASSSWRSPYVFEESPSCPNFANPSRPHQCKDCWLLQYVTLKHHQEQAPCRFVQLTSDGMTVDSLYRYATPGETEEALRKWLLARIHEFNEQLLEAASPFPLAS